MSNYFLKCKPLYIILLSSLGLGACANFNNNTLSSNFGYNNGNYNTSNTNNSSSQSPLRSELDSLTQSLKDTDNQMALNRVRKSTPDNNNLKRNNDTTNNSTSTNNAVYASQYNKINNDNNVVITIERPSFTQKDQNNITSLSTSKDSDTLVDNRNNLNSNNVKIELEPRPQIAKNTFDIVDEPSITSTSQKISNSNLNSETILASNFASRNINNNNFKVNLDWNDSVDLLFSKLSDKAGYKYATINHPRKNMIVTIHGDSLSFDDILRQAGGQTSSCFDVVKIQSEAIFTLKPVGICQIN